MEIIGGAAMFGLIGAIVGVLEIETVRGRIN
jgi:hypothetical protein